MSDLPIEPESTAHRLLADLRAARGGKELWEGRLSSSALSTAVAAFALHRFAPDLNRDRVDRALGWLTGHVNPDGGWGDTPSSRSNLSTTLLCWSAFSAGNPRDARIRTVSDGAARWIERQAGGLAPHRVAAAVRKRYGRDRTFATPILAMCAMSGRFGRGPEAWRHVPQVPFEAAALPASLYRWLRLPMVSYALPALIALGLVRHRRRPVPGLRCLRDRLAPRLLDRLGLLQPPHGGFLEAAPLTAFVALSLCEAGEAEHPVVRQAAGFLAATVRTDGSWPIDTNLDVWLTTQAVQALAECGEVHGLLGADACRRLRRILRDLQGRKPHPYTGAAPGGWAWTRLPGGVPDADDTSGALAALRRLSDPADADWDETCTAAGLGLRWLLGVQNRDGGLPTFCRGWSRLPFDRSCPDITAHALGAMRDWRTDARGPPRAEIERAMRRALRYLARAQNADGSWVPLWFGNEQARNGKNRVYGTARVLPVLCRMERAGSGLQPAAGLRERAVRWLRENRNEDGGWGAERGVPSSIEETALAVHALAKSVPGPDPDVAGGCTWLARRLACPEGIRPAPIGLYFARLYYAERLYPVIFSLSAWAAAHAKAPEPLRWPDLLRYAPAGRMARE